MMRRLSGILLSVSLIALPSFLPGDAGEPARLFAQEPFTFDGEVAMWSMAIKPDKISDFMEVLDKVEQALESSDRPNARRQLAGWKVVRGGRMPDGNIVFTHLIDPVVPGADYAILTILYEGFPDEQRAMYDLYAGAFGAPIGASVGDVVKDF